MSFLLWSGRAIGRRRAPIGLALAVSCFAAAYLVAPSEAFAAPRAPVAALLFAAGLAVLVWAAAMAHVGVRISAYNVRIRHGLLPMPPITVPLRMIRGVRAIEVRASVGQRWGWSWLPGRVRSVVVRSGPALVFDFGAGGRLMVSVDRPDEAVAAVQRMRLPTR